MLPERPPAPRPPRNARTGGIAGAEDPAPGTGSGHRHADRVASSCTAASSCGCPRPRRCRRRAPGAAARRAAGRSSWPTCPSSGPTPGWRPARRPTSCIVTTSSIQRTIGDLVAARARRRRPGAAGRGLVRRDRAGASHPAPRRPTRPPMLDDVLQLALAAVLRAGRRSGRTRGRPRRLAAGRGVRSAGRRPTLRCTSTTTDRQLICSRCIGPLGLGGGGVPVVSEPRPAAAADLHEPGSALSAVRLRRLPSLPEGVQRQGRPATGDAGRRHDRNAAA